MRVSDWCRLLGRRPCRRHIAAKEAVALSDTATQPNVRICRESRIAQAIAQKEPPAGHVA
jgi:hypothetical protein